MGRRRRSISGADGLRAVPAKWWGPAKTALESWRRCLCHRRTRPATVNVINQMGGGALPASDRLAHRLQPAAVVPSLTTQRIPRTVSRSRSAGHRADRGSCRRSGSTRSGSRRRCSTPSTARSAWSRSGGPTIRRRAARESRRWSRRYMHSATKPRIYYVEASAAVSQMGQPADECGQWHSATGWFVPGRRPGQVAPDRGGSAELRSCRTASYMLAPRGRQDRRPAVLAEQFSGYDHERFAVSRSKPRVLKLAVERLGRVGVRNRN